MSLNNLILNEKEGLTSSHWPAFFKTPIPPATRIIPANGVLIAPGFVNLITKQVKETKTKDPLYLSTGYAFEHYSVQDCLANGINTVYFIQESSLIKPNHPGFIECAHMKLLSAAEVLIGTTHCNGYPASEAVRMDLVDILYSDYYPPAMLYRAGI